MRSTLFYLPHAVGPLPLGGWGWLLLAILAWTVGSGVWAWRNGRLDDWKAGLPIQLLLAAGAVWIFPRLESRLELADGSDVILGLPVRGYGVSLAIAVLAGSYYAYRRGRPFGLSGETLMSLVLWSVLSGIAGARIFYVVQKWDSFTGPLRQRIVQIFAFTEGGLVVYGGVIAGAVAVAIWCRLHRFSPLRLLDIVTPPFLVGLAIGRVGCMLHGCCYGGICERPLPAVQFPVESPAYMDQLATGDLIGIDLHAGEDLFQPRGATVAAVAAESWADRHGVAAGDRLWLNRQLPNQDRPTPLYEVVVTHGGAMPRAIPLPEGSRPTHPAQLYAAINAAILATLLGTIRWSLAPSGTLFALGLIAYAVARTIEEMIRIDEAGQFGTSLSIGQWVSVLMAIVGCAILAIQWTRRRSVPS